MGFMDDLKENLGFDSEEEKAKKAAEKAAEQAKEAAEKAAEEAPAPDYTKSADPVPTQVHTAPAPDYTKSVPAPSVDAAPAQEAVAAAPKADKPKAAPKPQVEREQYRTYTVKSGDTLSEIGERFGVSYRKIAKLNNVENPDLIYPGQKFKIPND